MDPRKMSRKDLAKFVENENEEELEIRRQLAIEEFKLRSVCRQKAVKSVKNAS